MKANNNCCFQSYRFYGTKTKQSIKEKTNDTFKTNKNESMNKAIKYRHLHVQEH